ncbi:MAG: hypothetical protein J3K34DRAFT_526386 [Monoraphidium minutum]|nr:MAG: hypothetical protein J3K34DRAFT_526386 [Monoraphidium minutum]
MAAAVCELREQGNAAFRSGDYLRAAAAYTKAIKAEPDSAVLYSNRSLALMKLNKLTKALADAERATQLDPSCVKGWYRQAQILETQGHLEQAVSVLKEGSEAAGVAAAAGGADQELARSIRDLTRKLKGRCGGGGGGGGAAAKGVAENGGKTPASAAEAEALAFAEAWIQYAQEQLQEHGTDFAPTVHILPGGAPNAPDAPHPEASVQGKGAFADPAALADFVNFVRTKGEALGARAVVSVVPKSQVAFPQMWQHGLWPYAKEQDGVFVQLQAADPPAPAPDPATPRGAGKAAKPSAKATAGAAAGAAAARKQKDAAKAGADQGGAAAGGAAGGGGVRKLWFLRLGGAAEGGGFRARAPHELPHDLALLPTLLR